MPHCSGCSTIFANLLTGRCGRCKILEPKPKENWNICLTCGDIYEHLATKHCGVCLLKAAPAPTQVAQSTSSDPSPAIQYAMEHPTNPRTHGSRDTTGYQNPHHIALAEYENSNRERDNELRMEAERITRSVGGSYLDAVGRANPGVKIAKSKFKVPAPPPKALMKYNVVVKSVVNENKPRMKVMNYHPNVLEYTENVLWLTVVNDVRVQLDHLYRTTYDYPLRSLSDIKLRYLVSNTVVPDFKPADTITTVWNQSIRQLGLHVTEKCAKLFKLELVVFVLYPRATLKGISMEDDDEDDDWTHRTQATATSKRTRTFSTAAEASRQHPSKRLATATSGSSAYLTKIDDSVSETSYDIIQTNCEILINDGKGKLHWSRSKTLTARVEDKKFASGRTKHAYKMEIAGALYAAKRFYFTGNRNTGLGVRNEDNEKHLREELVRQKLAAKCLQKFNLVLADKRVNAVDLKVAEPFIVTVAYGPEKGLAWIADTLLDSTETRKFSGTDEAGTNKDLAGMTCDAFAHFPLHDSDGAFVLVDIQGILVQDRLNGGALQGERYFTLFDLMAHSTDRSMGMGDHGRKGISKFKRQHICNRICAKLGLDHLEATGSAESDSDSSSDPEVVATGVKQNRLPAAVDEPIQAPVGKAALVPMYGSTNSDNALPDHSSASNKRASVEDNNAKEVVN